MSLAVASILLSAGTYLFDFGSNSVVAIEYGRLYFHYIHLEATPGKCSDLCRNKTSELSGYFWAMLGIFIFSHTLNAIIFRFKFRRQDAPFRAAYFLPLIHLWRLLKLIWRTLSCHGIEDLRCQNMTGLFSMLGTALEGMPMLILQFCAFLVLSNKSIIPHMSGLFKVSVAASLISAAYNGGSSISILAINAQSLSAKLKIAIASGLFTMFAGLARCLTYVNIIVHIRSYFERHRTVRSRAKFHGSDTFPPVFICATICTYWLYYWILQHPRNWFVNFRNKAAMRRCLTCFVFSYMSFIVGPLYPMVSEAKDHGELGSFNFQAKLFLVTSANISIDLALLLVTFLLGTLSIAYFTTSVLASMGYIISILWYIWIDRQSGPVVFQASKDVATDERKDSFELRGTTS